jgi:hypothetical protein
MAMVKVVLRFTFYMDVAEHVHGGSRCEGEEEDQKW